MRIFLILFAFLLVACNRIKEDSSFSLSYYSGRFIKIYNFDLRHDSFKKFNNKFVRVSGFFYYDFEESAIFASRDDEKVSTAMWVIPIDYHNSLSDSLFIKKVLSLKGKQVELIGKIDTDINGHLGQYPAGLDSTFYIAEKK